LHALASRVGPLGMSLNKIRHTGHSGWMANHVATGPM
jgi:hypothetical protein